MYNATFLASVLYDKPEYHVMVLAILKLCKDDVCRNELLSMPARGLANLHKECFMSMNRVFWGHVETKPSHTLPEDYDSAPEVWARYKTTLNDIIRSAEDPIAVKVERLCLPDATLFRCLRVDGVVPCTSVGSDLESWLPLLRITTDHPRFDKKTEAEAIYRWMIQFARSSREPRRPGEPFMPASLLDTPNPDTLFEALQKGSHDNEFFGMSVCGRPCGNYIPHTAFQRMMTMKTMGPISENYDLRACVNFLPEIQKKSVVNVSLVPIDSYMRIDCMDGLYGYPQQLFMPHGPIPFAWVNPREDDDLCSKIEHGSIIKYMTTFCNSNSMPPLEFLQSVFYKHNK